MVHKKDEIKTRTKFPIYSRKNSERTNRKSVTAMWKHMSQPRGHLVQSSDPLPLLMEFVVVLFPGFKQLLADLESKSGGHNKLSTKFKQHLIETYGKPPAGYMDLLEIQAVDISVKIRLFRSSGVFISE